MSDIKCDWIIHGVCSNGGVVYHTHGLDKYGMTELELNLSINEKQAMNFINIIAKYLIENNIIIKNEYVDEKNIFNCDIYFRRVKGIYGDGEQNIRIILPDQDFLFPWDAGCDEPYCDQLKDNEIVDI